MTDEVHMEKDAHFTNALILTPEAPIFAPVPSILTPKALNLIYIEDLYDLKKS